MSKEENNYNEIGDLSKKTVDWSKVDTINSQVKYRGSGINTSNTFTRGVQGCNNSMEILNFYRNLYYKESQDTEQGIMAMAVNDVFMKAKELGVLEDLNMNNKNRSTHWLFIMNDDSTYGTTTDDFKAAIVELADYTGLNSPLFNKCINGFLNDDIEGLIQLFNQFSYYNIEQVYDVKKKLWSV